MACHTIWYDSALSPPYFVDPIHGMGAPGVGGDVMTEVTRYALPA